MAITCSFCEKEKEGGVASVEDEKVIICYDYIKEFKKEIDEEDGGTAA